MIPIPRYWAKATRSVSTREGSSRALTAWGWSDESRAEAEAHAHRRLGELVARLDRGEDLRHRYGYGSRPLREEILESLTDRGGEVAAVLTRNSYGCVVINAARTLFVDIDLPPATVRDWFRDLLGRPTREREVLENLRQVLQGSWRGSFRIYRTAGGYRVLATDPAFEPGSAEAERLMGDLGADPAFLQLCRAQRSFRARVTPKPWRCGLAAPPTDHPRETAEAEQAFAHWLQLYERSCAGWATCRLVDSVGAGRVHPDAALVLRVHDARSGAESGRSLA